MTDKVNSPIHPTTEFKSLSEKMLPDVTGHSKEFLLHIEDVKEFIRLLKGEVKRHQDGFVPVKSIDMDKIIDKLAGEKLTK